MDENIKIIKRDGRKQKFNRSKIYNAILGAFKSCEIEDPEFIDALTTTICDKISDGTKVEEIQDMIEFELMKSRYKSVAKAFILYRDERTKYRENKSKLMKNVADKLMAVNIVNQNANVDEASFGGRKGEANNEVMKWFALNNCMCKKSKENHENNRIYIHDLDSYSVGQHNCFDRATRFITSEGVKSFDDCSDGQEVIVLNKNGNWSPATVHMYGKQKMYDLLFTSGSTEKKVCCTRDHRWILSNGTVTTNIQVGDKLILSHKDDSDISWTLSEIKESELMIAEAWCVDEPETHSFTLDGGMVTGNCLSIPFDDLLAKGFNTRQTDIRPASSINTAFQLVAVIFQLQSLQQFGRQ